MAFILPVNGIEPSLGKNTFVAPNATIVGDVICGEDCRTLFG
jgi:carbonic anhydrase/acetyltransferase-like protein (isoleucine patch superfamily)